MNKASEASKQRAYGLVFGSLDFSQVTKGLILIKEE